MSYDLFFRPRSGPLDVSRFAEYFSKRPNYKVDLPQVEYWNEDTGVYFVFELQETDQPEPEGDQGTYPVSLEINFFRPSFFGAEAEPEVGAFVREFDMVVADPQIDRMGEGEYTSDLFLSGWNRGNEFGYSAILGQPGNHSDIVSYPREKLMNSWKWNLRRSERQRQLGDSVFVPRIMYLLLQESPVTAMVWPDGIPIAAIAVDYLVVARKELAPRRFFRRREDITLVAWSAALPTLKKYSVERPDGVVVLNYVLPPKEIQEYVRSLPRDNRRITGVSADNALDRELVEQYAVRS
ncbi:MAG: hypothetical protein AB1646_09650 [Thermodesulfobacteriota bacterium]